MSRTAGWRCWNCRKVTGHEYQARPKDALCNSCRDAIELKQAVKDRYGNAARWISAFSKKNFGVPQ